MELAEELSTWEGEVYLIIDNKRIGFGGGKDWYCGLVLLSLIRKWS